ncbi:MAG: hypothetical protein LUH22_09090 [Bacteroides sp.]|nr:hypothetical protein [Bacteroides sp.]
MQSKSDYITHVRTIFQYIDNSLLIGSDDRLSLFDQGKCEAKRIDIPQAKYSFSDQNIYSMAKDREGGIWLGTYFGVLINSSCYL